MGFHPGKAMGVIFGDIADSMVNESFTTGAMFLYGKAIPDGRCYITFCIPKDAPHGLLRHKLHAESNRDF